MVRCPVCGMKNGLYTGEPEIVKIDEKKVQEDFDSIRIPTQGLYAYRDFWVRFFNFKDESTRHEFLVALLGNLILFVFAASLTLTFNQAIFLQLWMYFPLAYVIIHFSITLRRLLDVECSRFQILFFYIPAPLFIYLISTIKLPWLLWVIVGLILGSMILYLIIQLLRKTPEDLSMVDNAIKKSFAEIRESNFGGLSEFKSNVMISHRYVHPHRGRFHGVPRTRRK
jgi:uncharacterized membrane protein YhaH (DUF805 family)